MTLTLHCRSRKSFRKVPDEPLCLSDRILPIAITGSQGVHMVRIEWPAPPVPKLGAHKR